jgi:hypothetical protein
MTKKGIIPLLILSLIASFFVMFIIPMAIDKEIARLDAVSDYNCRVYKACD